MAKLKRNRTFGSQIAAVFAEGMSNFGHGPDFVIGHGVNDDGRAANAAAQEIAGACADRLMQPVEANEIFVVLSPAEQAKLRAQGFDFYDWPAPAGAAGAARLVTAWNSDPAHVAALARALSSL